MPSKIPPPRGPAPPKSIFARQSGGGGSSDIDRVAEAGEEEGQPAQTEARQAAVAVAVAANEQGKGTTVSGQE